MKIVFLKKKYLLAKYIGNHFLRIFLFLSVLKNCQNIFYHACRLMQGRIRNTGTQSVARLRHLALGPGTLDMWASDCCRPTWCGPRGGRTPRTAGHTSRTLSADQSQDHPHTRDLYTGTGRHYSAHYLLIRARPTLAHVT